MCDSNVSAGVAAALSGFGYDVVRAPDLGLADIDDEILWHEAIERDRVIVSYDLDDFPPLYEQFFFEGIHHPELILISDRTIPQYAFGDQIRALQRVLERDEDLSDRLVYLAAP